MPPKYSYEITLKIKVLSDFHNSKQIQESLQRSIKEMTSKYDDYDSSIETTILMERLN